MNVRRRFSNPPPEMECSKQYTSNFSDFILYGMRSFCIYQFISLILHIFIVGDFIFGHIWTQNHLFFVFDCVNQIKKLMVNNVNCSLKFTENQLGRTGDTTEKEIQIIENQLFGFLLYSTSTQSCRQLAGNFLFQP